jgi:hypothetical protein
MPLASTRLLEEFCSTGGTGCLDPDGAEGLARQDEAVHAACAPGAARGVRNAIAVRRPVSADRRTTTGRTQPADLRARLTALSTERNEAVSTEVSMPTPQRVTPSTRHSV